MTAANVIVPRSSPLPQGISVSAERPMYAIAFDMDIESLKSNHGDAYNNAYLEIRKVELENPLAAVDVDKPADHELVTAILEGHA